MCFAPQRRALFRHLNLQKWREHVVFCTFWLRNVLRATTACTFSTSELPKVARTCSVLYIFTSKCASRHNGVHFFDISTSKSGPDLVCFVHFDFKMCFKPQRHALFQHRNFQKWSEPLVFLTFWLRNVLRATTPCNFSSLISPDVSAPAALASLLFNPPEPQNHEKTQCFATFLPFCAPASSFFWSFLFWLFSLLTAFSSLHIVGSLTSKLPSMSLVSLKLTLIHFHDVPMIFPWYFHDISMIFHDIYMIFHDFPWFSMIFPAYFHDISTIFPWYFHDMSMTFPRYFHDISTIFPWYCHDISMICPWYFHDISTIFPWYFHDISMDISMIFPWIFPWYFHYFHDISMIFPWYARFQVRSQSLLTVELPRWPYFSASGLILWPQTIWGEPPMPWPRATSTRRISMGFLWPIWFHRNSMGLHGVSMGFKRGSMRFHGGSIGRKGVSTGLSGIL